MPVEICLQPDEASTKISPSKKCNGCGETFPSRNAMFKHLKETDGACLSKDAYKDFVRYVRKSVKPPKVLLLYGYLPYNRQMNSSEMSTTNNPNIDDSKRTVIRNGQDAGNILIQIILELQNEIDGIDGNNHANIDASNGAGNFRSSVHKVNRSYGHFSRSAECVRQDMDTGTITEVMALRLYPLRSGMSLDDWLDRVQRKLDAKFQTESMIHPNNTDCCPVTPIRILGRQSMPNSKFNAEMDVSATSLIYFII